ncbi:MAG TPA: type 4a pilus biogenesis protein PilO [Pseudomonadales bacterium]|nr:type 4a pilus biogenesis protein PilO [Pseudomonadales bacterium]
MSLQEKFEKLQSDFSNLDPDNMGAWPRPVKVVCWLLAMVAVIALSYQLVLRDQQAVLDGAIQKEATLRTEFEQKVQEAANLDAYRAQMKEMTDSFSALLLQLPKDTEVPGLLDDISNNGQQSGLNFEAIDLQPEKKSDFYIELPISIKVKGGYHDFGAFVSGVAGLPRIVTLHDFTIVPADAQSGAQKTGAQKTKEEDRARGSEELSMTILAKTYRYKSAEDAEKDQQKDQQKGAVKGKGGGK